MNSHSQVPSPVLVGDRLRVFFASRPRQDFSLTSFVDLDPENPERVIYLHTAPVLQPGPSGSFDEHGIMPQHALTVGSDLYLFYAGWSRRISIPYSNWVGLAVSPISDLRFRKVLPVPVLDRTAEDLLSATGLYCSWTGKCWHGWYASGTDWLDLGERQDPTYDIRECFSTDLIHWTRNGRRILDAVYPDEANTRPWVIQVADRWLMWFCYRRARDFRDGTGSYRIGFAWSDNLETWYRRDDLAGIAVSQTGWDSTMIAYPAIVKVGERYLMFYNGNSFGKTGFGYAEVAEREMLDFAHSLSQ